MISEFLAAIGADCAPVIKGFDAGTMARSAS
jgi:hypothetical protein